MNQLIDGTEVGVEAHPNLNVSVISCYDLIQMEEKDVLAEISNQGVTRVQRITRKEAEKRVNTPALILTFCKTTYPEYVKIGLLHVPTRPYFPNPMLCYGCFNYGHTRVRCPGPQRCFNCSKEQHGEEKCKETAYCRNCEGDHQPTSRECPVYKKEMEVIKIKVRDNLTFPEARKRAEYLSKGSYAQATAQPNEILSKLKELELTMKRKDEQIAKLLAETKRKDEKIEQMKMYIHQIKQQFTNQEKPQHCKEQKQTNQPIGPVTRSRNNSPAVNTDSKRGRPQKQHTPFSKPTTTSPSPPPKRTATTTTNETMDCSDDEIEFTETRPNQPLR
ncbi:uncharacterized protein LOC131680304 [Topomyia yanbarensis]|uniref:uncharacterized protein LOC131680304 n=1 Tax=Topomyia yanbarensis TaxID=2498891 RepID=UPI00273AAB0F|nr:uncharacterized protein LOC131680304 [Topomyia yanbarensis]